MRRGEFEKAKLDELNTDLKEELERVKVKLSATEKELNDIRTTDVSDSKVHMNRIVSQNLARNSIYMSGGEEIKNEGKSERVDTEPDKSESEMKRENTLESVLINFLEEETGEAQEPSPVHSLPVFMDYKITNEHQEFKSVVNEQEISKSKEEYGIQVEILKMHPEFALSNHIQVDINNE